MLTSLSAHARRRVADLTCVSALILGFACGCSAWRGELDPSHNARISKATREIDQLLLRERSRTGPASVEQDLPSLMAARATATAPATTPADYAPATTRPSEPPASIPLSVAELRLRSMRHNLDLAVFLLDPEIARTQISEEEAKFDVTFFGGAGYKRSNPPRLDGDVVEIDSTTESLDGKVVKLTEVEQTKEMVGFDYGMEVPLPTGGKLRLRNVFDEQNKLEPKPSEQYISALKFSFSQPLLRNAGVDANVASIRLARLGSQVVDAKTKLSTIRMLALAEKTYWNAYAAARLLEIRTQQYNLAYDNLELVRKRVREGLSPRIETIRAEVGVTSRLESLIMARTQFQLQQRDLKRVLNMPDVALDSPAVIDITSAPDLVRLTLDRESLVRDALANRMEMLELELNLAADAIRVDLARNQALPLFTLDFDYGILDRQGSFGTSWQGMWDFDNSELAVGVRAEIPLTNEARKSRLRRALLGRSQRLATVRQREIAIRQEVHDTLDVLEQNWQRILAARQNLIVSGVNYEAELKQFQEGLRTMREVLEALTQLGEAQLKEVQAIVAYQVAQIDIAFATGTLLGYAGVGLEPVAIPGSAEGERSAVRGSGLTAAGAPSPDAPAPGASDAPRTPPPD